MPGLLLALLLAGGPQVSPHRLDAAQIAAWREDLRVMAEEMPRRHRNLFHAMTREQFEAAVAALDARIPELQRHRIIAEMARIAAMVGDGHTNVAPTRDPKIGFRQYPIRLYLFSDGLFVRSAAADQPDLAGARVTRIGSATAEEAYAAARELVGRDNEMDAKFFAPMLLTMPEVLNALGLVPDMERASLTVEKEGRTRAVVLAPAGPADLLPPDTDTSWKARDDWIDARPAAPSPLWLRDPSDKFWFQYLADSRSVYVQYNQVGNKDGETIAAFATRLFEFVDGNPVDRLVLDLRLNRGGDGGLNRPLLLGLIRSRKLEGPGRLFVLIGRSTWSAAQMFVNDLERYTDAVFIGEPSGGKVNAYGDSRKIILPHSGITVRVSSLWWQGDERDKRPWKAPDVAAELSFTDYRSNVDPAFSAALAWKPEKPLADVLLESADAQDPERARASFARWRAEPPHKYVDYEPALITLGYTLLGAGKTPEAIQIFHLAAEASPGSANAWDSLGEAYAKAGDRDAAIRCYEKAVALDPRMDTSRDALRKLRTP